MNENIQTVVEQPVQPTPEVKEIDLPEEPVVFTQEEPEVEPITVQ